MLEKYRSYFKEVGAEMQKVAWPEWEDLWASTKIVLFTMIILAAIIGVFDVTFKRTILWLIK